MDLKKLHRLNNLEVYKCPKLETISGLSSVAGLQVSCKLERIDIGECHQLQCIEGLEELQGLKSLVIQVPKRGDPSLWNCICGLRKLPSEYTVLIGKAVPEAKRNLNVDMFCGLIDAKAVAEVKRGESTLEMASSFSEITIYAFLVTSLKDPDLTHKNHSTPHIFPNKGEWMVTGLLTLHDSIVSLSGVNIQKGFMVTISKIEEGKALNVLQIIVDRLYRESMLSMLAAYDVIKRKRKY
ncbi:hypothetical protein SUGI_0667010 [Cryptomeria japonica]|nr:hypothetical protein SUGI_0667010 [Cryptomeria japonica]